MPRQSDGGGYYSRRRTSEVHLDRTAATAVPDLTTALRVDAAELFSRSRDRLTRQAHICDQVAKSHQRPNISALARQFGVARRTIIRDLQELIRRGQLKPEAYPEWENPREDLED